MNTFRTSNINDSIYVMETSRLITILILFTLTLRYLPRDISNGMPIVTSKLIITSCHMNYRQVAFYTSL